MTSAISRATARLTALLPTRADLADTRRAPRRDLLAGPTVAIVALPLALGFGVFFFGLVVLVPIVGAYGPTGVPTVGVMAGVMLVAPAALRAGTYLQYANPASSPAVREEAVR
jgi:SulP family sulfate permease